jgi:ABC-type phosphate/phosphonate transport system substrate-binding protein
METPQPVDLNKLKNILGNAKAVMNKVENNSFKTGNINGRALTEDGVAELQSEGVRPVASSPMTYNEEMIKNSKLPAAIKKAMLENPIPQLSGPSHTFNINDVSDLIDEKPMPYPKAPKTKVVNETYSNNKSDTITVSKSDLREMVNDLVNEKLLEFFVKNHNKSITEDAVKRTITTLIKEGKIQQKTRTL